MTNVDFQKLKERFRALKKCMFTQERYMFLQNLELIPERNVL